MRPSIMARALFAVVALVGFARAADDLDSPKADPSHHKVEFENDAVRIVRWAIPPHEKTTLHNHPNVVNVLLTDGDLKITSPEGKASEAHVKAGSAAFRAPTVHVAENVGDKPVEGILVEPKGAPSPAWTPPARDAVKVTPHDKLEFENEHVRILRYAYDKGESAPMHDHPAGVQVLLTDVKARQTTADGKTADISGKRGTVRFRPPLSHAVENTGERFEGIVVDLKNTPSKTAGR
jgi:beta-alanine degradation protein BauB